MDSHVSYQCELGGTHGMASRCSSRRRPLQCRRHQASGHATRSAGPEQQAVSKPRAKKLEQVVAVCGRSGQFGLGMRPMVQPCSGSGATPDPSRLLVVERDRRMRRAHLDACEHLVDRVASIIDDHIIPTGVLGVCKYLVQQLLVSLVPCRRVVLLCAQVQAVAQD